VRFCLIPPKADPAEALFESIQNQKNKAKADLLEVL
jgi:hypothetical protein